MHQALSSDQLYKLAPSIFATQPWEGVSKRYAFIPTIKIVNELSNYNFYPVSAMQSLVRTSGKRPFAKHLIRFRRGGDVAHAFGDCLPEIVLVNSHDKSSSYTLSAGVFRMVCANGLIVKAEDYGTIRVQHQGDVLDRVIEGSFRIVDDMPRVMDSINRMRGIALTDTCKLTFAKAALSLRYHTDEHGNIDAPIRPEALLMTRRQDDSRHDLWTVFNRVQENFIRGGLCGVAHSGRRVWTRAIRSVNEDVRLNRALWLLADELSKKILAHPQQLCEYDVV